MPILLSLISGLLFGYGLALSDMLSPARVQGFLDVFGEWDATLIFVMIGAVSVSVLGHFFIKKKSIPFFAEKWHFPWEKKGIIDKRLVSGSLLFGIGWGLAGLCPGPAIGGIVFIEPSIIIFLMSMLVTMTAYKYFLKQ